jgi:hypothetical protein
MNRHHWAVILAGGDGVRLRSMTRGIAGDDRPKQFCPLVGEDALLTETRKRAALTGTWFERRASTGRCVSLRRISRQGIRFPIASGNLLPGVCPTALPSRPLALVIAIAHLLHQ